MLCRHQQTEVFRLYRTSNHLRSLSMKPFSLVLYQKNGKLEYAITDGVVGFPLVSAAELPKPPADSVTVEEDRGTRTFIQKWNDGWEEMTIVYSPLFAATEHEK